MIFALVAVILIALAVAFRPLEASVAILVGSAVASLAVLVASRAPTVSFEARVVQVESSTDAPPSFTKGLPMLLLAALGVRMMVAIFVNSTRLWVSFGPDAVGWEAIGRSFFEYLSGASHFSPDFIDHPDSRTIYAVVNGLSVALFGSARYPLSFLNCFIGILAALLSGKLAERIYGPEAGRRALLLGLFFPSLMLWGAMNLREVWAHVAILTFVLAGMTVRQRISPKSLSFLLLALLFVVALRRYLVPLLLLSFFLSFFLIRIRHLPYAIVSLGLVVLVVSQYGEALGMTEVTVGVESLDRIQRLREGLAYGGSAYGANVDTSTIGGALRYLPTGMMLFLFSPFPWNISSWQQAIAAPEALAWAFLCLQGIRQGLSDIRTRLTDIALPALLIAFMTIAYGLVSGNEGTAFRHRAQVMMLALPFAAAWQCRKRVRAGASREFGPQMPQMATFEASR
jgi:hypothetical protein